MSNVDSVVIVDSSGRMLRSAWFSKEHAVRASFVSEFPDAATFTPSEAKRTAKRLAECGFSVKCIDRYGFSDETVIAHFVK